MICEGYQNINPLYPLSQGNVKVSVNLIQIEAISFPEYGAKIPNHNTQILYPVK